MSSRNRDTSLRLSRRLRAILSWRNAAAITVIATVLLAGFFLTESITNIIASRGTADLSTAAALLCVKVLTYILAPLGGAGIKVLAGSIFGWQIAFVILVVGDTLGSIINFYLGKHGIRAFFGQRTQNPSARIGRWSLDNILGLTAARFVLSPAWDLISYGLGAKGVSFRKFLLASIVGGVPASLAWSILGSYLVHLIGQTGAVVVALVGVGAGLIVACIVFIFHRRNRINPSSTTTGDEEPS